MADTNDSTSSPLTVSDAVDRFLSMGSDDVPADTPAKEGKTDSKPADDARNESPEKETPETTDDAKTEGDEPEETAEEVNEESQTDEAELKTFTVDIDGTEIEVQAKDARAAEAVRKAVLRQKDYTQKTQKLAEDRKVIETEVAAARQQRQKLDAKLAETQQVLDHLVPAEPDWNKVRAERPDDFLQLREEWRIVAEGRAKVAAERQRIAEEEAADQARILKARAADEYKLLVEVIPELKDETKGKKYVAELQTYLTDLGFPEDTLRTTLDHRLIVLLDKARKYDAVQKAGKTLADKEVRDVPKTPVIAPGGARTQESSKQKTAEAAISRAKKSGRMEDAVEALLHIKA